MTIPSLSLLLGLSACFASTLAGQDAVKDASDEAAQTKAFQLPVGWEWELEPTPLRESWRSEVGFMRFVDSGAMLVQAAGEGIAVVLRIQSEPPREQGARVTEYRPYLFDEGGLPFLPAGTSSMSNERLGIVRQRFSVASAEPKAVGLARLTFEGRGEASAAGQRRADEIGARVLPLPIPSEQYDFELPTLDGKTVRSEDLKGKVVLIDCWATWCGPCMAKMPKLKEVHEKYADQGLVVIGISFDGEKEPMQKAIAELGLDWHQVHAKSAAAGEDDLWEQVTGVSGIPRLFLIDRDGVLRRDFYPHDLEAQVLEVLEAGEDAGR